MKTWQMLNNELQPFILISDSEAIAQNVVTNLQMVLNDCFFAMDTGLNLDQAYQEKNQEDYIQNTLLGLILQTEGVSSAEIIDFKLNQGSLYLKYSYIDSYQQSVINTITL